MLHRMARFGSLLVLGLTLAGTSNAAEIAAFGGFTLQVVTDGTVWAWGNNASGQLGDNTFVNHTIAQPVSGISSVTAVAAGGNHSMALKSDGTVWTWGSNSNGQLGDGTFNFHAVPAQVPGLTGIIAIAAEKRRKRVGLGVQREWPVRRQHHSAEALSRGRGYVGRPHGCHSDRSRGESQLSD